MEYTELQKAEFREAYAARRTRQLVFTVVFIVLIVPVAIASDRVKGLPILLFILVFGGLAFSLRNWRCPACNGYLGRTFNPKFCQKCGAQLHD
jgi:hypothetical protein